LENRSHVSQRGGEHPLAYQAIENIKDAEREAALMVAEARKKAAQMMKDGREKADAIIEKAQKRPRIKAAIWWMRPGSPARRR
jgi:cell division septum initiation protein DivIVA